jgi:hypothetical protein
MADECPHPSFEALVTVHPRTDPGGTAYHQARLQVRCTECGGPLLFAGLPAVNPQIFHTVAVGAGGAELYLSGMVTPPTPAFQGQQWQRAAMPPPEPPPAAAP